MDKIMYDKQKIDQIAQRVAFEHPTELALKRYYELHPKADKKIHWVKGDFTPAKFEQFKDSHLKTNPKEFKSVLERNKKSDWGTSVDIEEKYPENWTLLTNKGKDCTVAITEDGNITGVSKNKNSKEIGWGMKAVQIAIKHGGTHLDCFNTVLPKIYSKAGMVAVARIKWDDSLAPKDWDYKKYSLFNKGRPDVIFMVYDGKSKPFDIKHVPLVKNYESAQKLQKGVIELMKKKQRNRKADTEMILGKNVQELCQEVVKELMDQEKMTKEQAEYWVRREF